MAKQVSTADIDKVIGQIGKLLDAREVFKELAEKHGKNIANVITGSAKAGIGPMNAQFAGYSESYKKAIARAGEIGVKAWLVGLGRRSKKGGMAGAMLDQSHFTIEPPADARGQAHMVYQARDDVMVYARVHQGSALGGANDTRGNIPPRPFLHFLSARNVQALWTGLRAVMQNRVSQVKHN